MATLIFPDGTECPILPENLRDFKLEEMQTMVGGLIEVLDLENGKIMVINEEGKPKRLLRNDKATILFRAGRSPTWDFISGPALVCEPSEVE